MVKTLKKTTLRQRGLHLLPLKERALFAAGDYLKAEDPRWSVAEKNKLGSKICFRYRIGVWDLSSAVADIGFGWAYPSLAFLQASKAAALLKGSELTGDELQDIVQTVKEMEEKANA